MDPQTRIAIPFLKYFETNSACCLHATILIKSDTELPSLLLEYFLPTPIVNSHTLTPDDVDFNSGSATKYPIKKTLFKLATIHSSLFFKIYRRSHRTYATIAIRSLKIITRERIHIPKHQIVCSIYQML